MKNNLINQRNIWNATCKKRPEKNRKPIEKIVCDYFCITTDEVKSDSQIREYVWSRDFIWLFKKQTTNKSLRQLGEPYKKDHATVIHGIRTLKNLLETDKLVKEHYNNLITTLIQEGYYLETQRIRKLAEI
jgi:chromosomal replication initiation ATPase DnaA